MTYSQKPTIELKSQPVIDDFSFPTLILQIEAVCLVAWTIFYAFAKWLGLL